MPESRHPITDFLEITRSVGPSFSPDGERIAVLNNQSGSFQLYTIRTDGTDQRECTSFPEPIEGAAFSPITNDILFIRSTGGNEEQNIFLRKENGEISQITPTEKAKHAGGVWSRDGEWIAYASTIRNQVDFDVFVVELKTGTHQSVFSEGGNCYPLSFSPNGKYLGFYRHIHTSDKELFVIDLEKGTSKKILPASGEQEADYHSMRWLPDSSGFYYLTDQKSNFVRMCFYSLADAKSTDVLRFDWDISSISLTRDGSKLALTINEEGYSRLRIYNTKTWAIQYECPMRGEIGSCKWDTEGNQLAFVFTNAQNPANVWVYCVDDQTLLPVTHSVSTLDFSTFIEQILEHYFSFDDMAIPVFSYYPNTGEKSPVIVHLHGGPSAQETSGFSGLYQYFLKRGYAVIAPNIRGSTGYGKQYTAADDRRKRGDTIRDLEYLHAFIRENPRLDASRVALYGGSYGGYMVLAGLAFQPDSWAAGIDVVGISNLVTFLKNTSPYRRKIREVEYGYLGEDTEFMESISPSNYIQNIRAPLLVIHGANDPRVPLSEAENIVEKLRTKGNHVELKVYSDEGHGLAKLNNRVDAYSRVVDFLDEVFQKKSNQQ